MARARYLCISALLLLLAENILASESPAPRDLYRLSLQELLELKISSSTLTPLPIKTAPAAVTLITRDQIQNLPYRYLHDLLNHAPGFQSFRQAEAGDEYYHSVRGRRVGTASREVLILINGN